MMVICLLFWFFTISVSVTASAIYLLKRMEGKNKRAPTAVPIKPATGKRGLGDKDDYKDDPEDGYNNAYANYDVLGFLIDALYAGDEENSHNRSVQASKSTTTTRKPTSTTPELEYPGPDDEEVKTTTISPNTELMNYYVDNDELPH